MRLLHPSPGEVVDRLSILELKIQAAQKRGIDSTHFEAEKVSLEEVLRSWDEGVVKDSKHRITTSEVETLVQVAAGKNALAAVNALLWQAEDEVRATPDTAAFKLAALCKRIVKLNDARSGHVRDLDLVYGIKDGPEKLYAVGGK